MSVTREFHCRLQVRSYELDRFDHVNHAVFLNYLEYARQSSLRELGLSFQALQEQGILYVVAGVKIDYLKPLREGDEVEIITRYEFSGRRSFLAHQEIVRLGDSPEAAARARITLVSVDSRGRSCPVHPEQVKLFLRS